MEIIAIILEKPVGSGIIGVLCLILILGCIAGIDNKSKSGSDSIAVSTEIPDRMNLADLHVFATHSSVLDNIESGSVTDAYGHTYAGPYFDLCSYGDNLGSIDTEAFTELVADGNFKYFSGTFFARPEQDESYTIEFFVYADDVLVYSSGPITRDARPIDFNIDIGNCNIVRVMSRSTDFTSLGTNPGIILVNTEVYK